ncbi:MAG: DUF1800 domain-containing protein [Chitinophagaceae bacterium]|nr:DUF1800 domain-containing protein [Chitinophagaceae bacterium]
MDRRDFLAARIKKKRPIHTDPSPVYRTLSGINPYAGNWSDEEVIHLLKRTMFGARKSDVDYFKTRGLNLAVDELLNPVAADPAPPIKEYATATTATTPDGNILQGTTWINDLNNDGTVQSQRRASYKKWLIGNMINQDRSIREKMILLWIDHFGNESVDVGNANWIFKQQQLIRQFALGNFKNLVFSISTDVSMLRYLNGYLNQAAAPDENYGRELMELFTIGKGPDSHYTEADVKEAAKVLTGWQINGTTALPVFTSSRHSTVNKQFSSFFNNTVITGRTGATAGTLELTDLINMIFAQNEVAKYIVRRFYRWFVYYQIDSATEANVIAPLADIFRSNNYEIKPVLNALFKSEHFYDRINRGCMIKNPADHVVGTLREMNVSFPASTDWSTNYGLWNIFNNWLVNMGQNPHDPPNVSGMPAYYQEPSFHEIWITADTLPKRNQYTDTMINSGYSVNSIRAQINCVAFAQSLSNPGNPNDLIDESVKLLFRNDLSTQSKAQIKTQILLSGQQWDYYWTNAWMAWISSPTTANFNVINTRLKSLYQYLFNLSEYQLA